MVDEGLLKKRIREFGVQPFGGEYASRKPTHVHIDTMDRLLDEARADLESKAKTVTIFCDSHGTFWIEEKDIQALAGMMITDSSKKLTFVTLANVLRWLGSGEGTPEKKETKK